MKATGKSNSYWKDVLGRFVRHKLAVIGLVIIVLEVLAVLILPSVSRSTPTVRTLSPAIYAKPSASHILGTDDVGRDLFARVLSGGRTSLYVGVVSALISVCIGAPLGLLAGYYGKGVEMVIMRLADVFQSIPSMILVLVLVSVIGPSVTSVTLVIGVLGWASSARILHSSVLSVRGARLCGGRPRHRHEKRQDHVPLCAAQRLCAPAGQLFLLHRLGDPHGVRLSFLGMGVQPPNASWGNILYAAQSISILTNMPWVWVPTGLLLC